MKEITFEGVSVKVEMINGSPVVEVGIEDGTVKVNNLVLWKANVKDPRLNDAPVVMHNLLGKGLDYVGKEGSETIYEIWRNDKKISCTMYVPDDQTKVFSAQFDYITSLSDIEHDIIRNVVGIEKKEADEFVEKFIKLEKDIENAVNVAGYSWGHSHDTGDFPFAYYRVHFDIEKYDETALVNIWSKFALFDEAFNAFLDKYNLN